MSSLGVAGHEYAAEFPACEDGPECVGGGVDAPEEWTEMASSGTVPRAFFAALIRSRYCASSSSMVPVARKMDEQSPRKKRKGRRTMFDPLDFARHD